MVGKILLGLAIACLHSFFIALGFPQNNTLVIAGGTLIDGTGRAPISDALIVIEGNRIKTIGQKGRTRYPSDAEVIEADGKYILPGLWDMHVHYYGWMGQLFLSYGITSILNWGMDEWVLAQREGIAKGKIVGPRIFIGSLGSDSRGFVEQDMLFAIPFGNKYFPSHSGGKGITAEMARRMVREAVARGADAIGEIVNAGPDPEILRAITDEAHKAGRPVGGHIILSAKDAVLAGVDSLLHLSGVQMATMDFDKKASELRAVDPRFDVIEPRYMRVVDPRFLMTFAFVDQAKIDELIKLMVQRNVYIEPDLMTIAQPVHDRGKAYEREVHELFKDPRLQYVPADNVMMASDYSAGMYQVNRKLKPDEFELMRKGYRNIQTFIKKFASAGGKILAGVDTHGVNIPGIGMHYELRLLVDAGLTPMQAIQSATKNAAEWLRKGDELGTVEEGKIADIIIVNGNPLEDISNTKRVEAVIRDGKLVSRDYAFVNPIPQPPRGEGHANPEPKIESISPIVAVEGDSEVTLTVKGSYFIEESVVEFDGTAVPTEHVSLTELRAKIPGHLLARAGTFPVTVLTPKPFGGRSNRAYFIVKFR